METATKQSLETKAGSSVRPVQPRSVGSTVGSDSKRQGPWPRGPAHKGASTHAVQEAVKSGPRFPQPLTGRGADSLSCSDGAVSSVSPSPVLTESWVGQGHSFHSRLPEESVRLPAGRRAAPRHPPGAPGANVDGALAQPVLRKPHRGMVVRVSQMEGHETQKGKSQLLTAASASGKPRGCRVLKEAFSPLKDFLFVHSLLAALGLRAGCGLSAVCERELLSAAVASLVEHRLQGVGLAAPRHMGSSQTRGRAHGPCAGTWILSCRATRAVLFSNTM